MTSVTPPPPTGSSAPRPGSRRLVLGGLGLVVIALAAAGLAAWHDAQPYHFLVVEPGTLYRSGVLEPADLEQIIRTHHIKTIVNLQPASINELPWHALERDACERQGARQLDLPMEPETPATPAEVKAWLDLMDDPKNLPVLVHCQHGVIRTGMMVAVFQVARRGLPAARAFEEMPRFGHDFDRPWRKPIREFILALDPATLPPPPAAAPPVAPPPTAAPPAQR